MTSPSACPNADFDRLIAWFEADARVREPEDAPRRALSQTRAARADSSPGSSPNGGFPCNSRCRLRAVPRLAPILLLIALLLAAVVAIAVDRLPAATAGSVRTGRQRPGRLPVERPDLRREPGRLESDPADVRRRIGVLADLVARWDEVRLQADRPNLEPIEYVGQRSGRRRRRWHEPASRSIAEARDISPASWSPDGRWLVYARRSSEPATRSSSRRPTARARRYALEIPATINWSPIFSPDGTKIVYFVGQAGDGIGVMNRDGSNARILNTTPFAEIDSATWHPDGNRIVVSAAAATARHRTSGSCTVDGSPEQRLAVPGRAEVGPSWSPTGDRLVYLSSEDGVSFLLHVADANGANERRCPASTATSIHRGRLTAPELRPSTTPARSRASRSSIRTARPRRS